ncbi:p53 and DNA damage-regulated protein 1 [Parasteatoda tepidariorum]|uniref:p53 and DNA damage-regulated protein 1 n=1 Tax=Parasteatoda tepidariorum TaxID=114398 RepID=UPI001C726850|nr:p53 and DNA damage-regulated protein 1 [Parasteatoda tepidariorum]XP_015911915.2 p53 and DNA damage-regulated protein 1 [Parasteatoda tepidariorum]XP_015911916.2 p53 and DNA damage-regulated protein 1 [Parasteatoda tepidariorum]XP_042902215.1 p53 and DNA damage-regulated protein 1 [Parasteatoda tepidariorum]
MAQNTAQCLDYLSKLEETAQDILIDKEQIVNLNRRSNTLREAKRALQAELKKEKPTSKTWLCFGNMFIKCPTPKALTIVEKDETVINEEINKIRDNLKPKVENMRNLEGKPPSKFNLKPLNKDEVTAMQSLLPTVY